MSSDNFIPVGRTSLAKNGNIVYQVQTEYAARPYPRVTTSVLNNGQVLHKVEKRLDRPVSSLEERSYTEAMIFRQHGEVMATIQKKEPSLSRSPLAEDFVAAHEKAPLYRQLNSIPGFQHVYRLNTDGTFISEISARQFKKTFSKIYKHVQEVVEVFALIPGALRERQKGVYEIEPYRLYFVSVGSECYFVSFLPSGEEINYETILQKMVFGEE
jgi:hypothetical protein